MIDSSERHEELAVRLQILLHEITLAVYTNVSRGLFERHKLAFSFMLCTSIFRQAGIINEAQWNFLLHGPVSIGMVSHREVMVSSDSFSTIQLPCFKLTVFAFWQNVLVLCCRTFVLIRCEESHSHQFFIASPCSNSIDK